MAKRVFHGVFIPASLWQNTDLSWIEKIVLMEIFSFHSGGGVSIGVTALSHSLNISGKMVKEALKSLYAKKALEVKVDEDGAKTIIPLIYKTEYREADREPVIGDKPTDTVAIDFGYITESWNSICFMLPKIASLTPQRRKKLRAVIKSLNGDVERLVKVFRLISTSHFLNGSKSPDWNCTFDWVIKSSENVAKILEGNYHRDHGEQADYNNILHGITPSEQETGKKIIYR